MTAQLQTNIIILLGGPGAGKGTVAARLAKTMQAEHLSTGDLLRETAGDTDSEIGRTVSEIMARGDLVPDDMMTRILGRALRRVPGATLLLDGFPRTTRQAELLSDELEAVEGRVRAVVLLEVSDDVLMERLSGRLVCGNCGAVYHQHSLPPRIPGVCDACDERLVRRGDDEPETVRKRLSVYHEKTAPLVAWYAHRGLLLRLDGEGSVAAVVERVRERLDAEPPSGGRGQDLR